MLLTHRCDYDPELSAVYQCYAWDVVTVSLQQALFLLQIRTDTDQNGVSLTETQILTSPGDVIELTQECKLSLIDLEATVLCPKWLSKTSESWKSYALEAIWEAVAEDGQVAGWRYDTVGGEQIFEIYGSEPLEWRKAA